MPASEVPARAAPESPRRLFVVDLDDTLVRTDLLAEHLLLAIKRKPLAVLRFLFWLAAGRAIAKTKLANEVRPDASLLPYRSAVLELIGERRARGDEVVLASASPQAV